MFEVKKNKYKYIIIKFNFLSNMYYKPYNRLKRFMIIISILFITGTFRYIFIQIFQIDTFNSLYNYTILMLNVLIVFVWFSDKIYQVKIKKFFKVNWGLQTEYIISQFTIDKLLYLISIYFIGYFIITPFIHELWINLLSLFIRDVHAESPPPTPPHVPWTRDDTVRDCINPSVLPGQTQESFSQTPFYFKTQGSALKPYFFGQRYDGPLAVFCLNDNKEPFRVGQLPAFPPPNFTGFYYQNHLGMQQYTGNLHTVNKEIFKKGIDSFGRVIFRPTGMFTPHCPIHITNHQ
jgi:hypothetical protein